MPEIIGAKFNPGKILGFLEIDQRERPSVKINFIDLDAESVAIMGKNGSGKTEILKKMADTVLPEFKCQKYGDLDKYWTGGFVFSPEGMKDDQQEIFKDTSIGGRGKFIKDIDKSDLVFDSELLGKLLDKENTHENKIEIARKHSNLILRYEYVFPWQLKLTRAILREKSDWQPEFNSKITNEISKQNQYLLMMHPVPDSTAEFDQSFSAKYEPEPLICRVVTPNEDTPKVSQLRTQIMNCYYHLSEEKIVFYEQIVEKFIYGIPGKFDSLATNPIFTPFIMHWDLLTSNYDEEQWPEFFDDALKNFPKHLIEWPQDRFQFNNNSIINIAVDTHLHEPTFHENDTDIELLSKATIVTSVDSIESIYKYRNSKIGYNTSNIWEQLILSTSKILDIWEVTPKWFGKFENETELKRFGIRIDFEDGNLRLEYTANINQTTRRWIYRAFQCALLASSESPYKVVIWDEPELGLHPTATQNIINRVMPWLRKNNIKLITATHSAILGSEANKLFLCERDLVFPNKPRIKELPSISSDLLHEVGLTKLDLLSSIKNFLIVEGEHDRVVFETLFAKELADKKTKVLTFGGTENLLTLPESEVLFEYFNTNFVFMLDGKKRSQIQSSHKDYVAEFNAAFKQDDASKSIKLVDEVRDLLAKRKVFSGAEIHKLLSLLEKWSHLSKKKITSLSKISFVMLDEGDIIHYLSPRKVLQVQRDLVWKNLRQAYHARENKDLSEKEFYKRKYGANISITSVRSAAKELMDSAIPQDFLKVIASLDS